MLNKALDYLNEQPAYIGRRWAFGVNVAVLALIAIAVMVIV